MSLKLGQKILLVDDDADFLESVANYLKYKGFSISEANNGDIGQFMTMLADFDLIITDFRMPAVDGVAMTSFIKNRVTTPIIVLTGYVDEEVEAKAKNAKADLVLSKTISPDLLFDEIKKILSK